MDINEMVQKVKKFEISRGWDKTSSMNIIKLVEAELPILKRTTDRKIVENKVGDLLILNMQLAIRNKIDLNQEFINHMERSEKKYLVKEDGSD